MERKEIALESGVILVAPPTLIEPNFRRSVVFLCEHSPEGSFGLILNHNVSLPMSDLMADLSSYTDPVRIGGPVQMDTLHFLHRFGDEVSEAIEIVNGVYWGGELNDLQRLFLDQQATGQDLRFFLGYAGWTDGQLDEEVKAGGWLLLPSSVDLVFCEEPGKLWRDAMLLLGGEYSLLANFPEDPILN